MDLAHGRLPAFWIETGASSSGQRRSARSECDASVLAATKSDRRGLAQSFCCCALCGAPVECGDRCLGGAAQESAQLILFVAYNRGLRLVRPEDRLEAVSAGGQRFFAGVNVKADGGKSAADFIASGLLAAR